MSAWVVDTCVVLDVARDDATFGVASARLLQTKLADGLVITPVTFIELAPAFHNDLQELKRFLDGACVSWHKLWTRVAPDA